MIPTWALVCAATVCLLLGYVTAAGLEGAQALAQRYLKIAPEDFLWWSVIAIGTWLSVTLLYPAMARYCEPVGC